MEALSQLADGFAIALTWQNIGLALLGCFLGTIIGALPGLGPSNGVAILIPLVFSLGLPATPALILLTSVYYGAMYGGRISSILLNIPGDEPALMTTLDGYPMARKGQAGEALALSGIASFFGAFFATWGLVFLAPQLVKVALLFGTAEYFALFVLAFATLGGLSSRNQAKAALAAGIGLAISMVGVDGQTGVPRFTFGEVHFYDGIDFLVAIVGLFALSEVFIFLEHRGTEQAAGKVKLGRIIPPWSMVKSVWGSMSRGTVLGFIAGVLPGAGASLGSFIAYSMEKRVADREGTFGTGDPRGVAAPEAGNNAAAGGALVPMLALGVPGSDAAGAQHHSGTALVSGQSGRCLGADRGTVHRQHHAAGAQHSHGQHLRAGSVHSLQLPDAGGGDDLLRRYLRHFRLDLRPDGDDRLRRARLAVAQARRTAGADHSRRPARRSDGKEPAPHDDDLRRRPLGAGRFTAFDRVVELCHHRFHPADLRRPLFPPEGRRQPRDGRQRSGLRKQSVCCRPPPVCRCQKTLQSQYFRA